MHPARYFILTSALFLALPAGPLRSADAGQPSAAEAKLRESLRNTILQLRTSENEKATLQAAQAESDEKIKTLTAQGEELTKRINDQKLAADKVKADLETELTKRDADIAALKTDLTRSVDDDKKVTGVAQAEAAQIAKLQDQVSLLNRRVAEQQTKNAAMFKIANEILQRYEKFGLGDALTAREPFTGITRVKLQSLFEDYQDKLVNQKIKPETAAGAAASVNGAAPNTTPVPDKSGKSKATPAKSTDPKPRSS